MSDCEELSGSFSQEMMEVGFSNAEHLNKLVRSLYMSSFSYNLIQKEIFLKLDKNQYQKYIQLSKVKKCGWFKDKLSLSKY